VVYYKSVAGESTAAGSLEIEQRLTEKLKAVWRQRPN